VVIKRRQIITVLIGAMAVCAISYADMMPVSPRDAADGRQSPRVDSLTDLRPAGTSLGFADFLGIADLDSLPVGFLPPLRPSAGPTSETRPAQILMDRQSSLTLCLYALLGLGLCRSAPFVKKLHFSCIPDWYHSGGPYQIGHSFAISPNCLPSAPVFCFVQPEPTAAIHDLLLQHRRGIVVSLWRESQFAPGVLDPRGPPFLS
jgi:hypothetical protein